MSLSILPPSYPPEVRGYVDRPVRLTLDTANLIGYADRPPQWAVGTLNVQALSATGRGFTMPGYCPCAALPAGALGPCYCPECCGWGKPIAWHLEQRNRLIVWCIVRVGGGYGGPVWRPLVIVDTPAQEWLPLHWRSSMAAYLWRWPDSAHDDFYGRWATCRTGEDRAARRMPARGLKVYIDREPDHEDAAYFRHTMGLLYPWGEP